MMIFEFNSGTRGAPSKHFFASNGNVFRSKLFVSIRSLTYCTGLVFLANTSSVQATIVADASRPDTVASISAGANGSSIVNINSANYNGISHNIYTQFDVDKAGVILNNSMVDVNTQLAGKIGANNNLSNSNAQIILNEVNSRNPSLLNGMIEVAGEHAQVIIANSSGITCNGCGFINADRATLTTGKAKIVDGNILSYKVEQGRIVITGDGLESRDVDYTNLIARSVTVNADIWAKDLNVVSGSNVIDADGSHIFSMSVKPGSVAPSIAIDVSKLGGMYADKITLIGTERGVGVRNEGKIDSSSKLIMDVNGQLVNQHGSMTAYDVIDITTSGLLDNRNGRIFTSKHNQYSGTRIKSKTVDNRNGEISAQSVLDVVTHGVLDNGRGKLLSEGLTSIMTNGNTLNNTSGRIMALYDLDINSGEVKNNSGLLKSLGELSVNTNGKNLNNSAGYAGVGIIGDHVTLLTNHLNNNNGRILSENTLYIKNVKGISNLNGVIKVNDLEKTYD